MEDQRIETCDQLDEKTIVLLYPLLFLPSLIKFDGFLGETWWGIKKKIKGLNER